MLPIWPNVDRIPVWVWLLAVAAFVGVGFLVSMPGFDMEAAGLHLRQAIAGGVSAVGLFWGWRGGWVLWQLHALRTHGMDGEAVIAELRASSQRVKRSGPFAVGTTNLTQHFLTYRLAHPGGEVTRGPMRIDSALAEGLRQGGTVKVRYLPGRPQVSAPAAIDIRQVQVMRGLQLVAGAACLVWSLGWLWPDVI